MAINRRTKKRVLILATLCAGLALLAVGGLTARKIQRARTADRFHREGLAAYEAGDHDTAIRRLAYYAPLHPKDGEAWLKLCDSRRQVPMPNNRHLFIAVQCAQRAADALPGDVRPLEMQIDLYRRLGFAGDALSAAERLLAIDPNHRDALAAMLGAQYMLGRTDDAVRTAERLLAAHPGDSGAHETMVDLMVRQNRAPQDIRQYVDDAAAQHPDNVDIAMLQVRVRILANDLAGAREAAARAASVGSADPATLSRLLAALDLLGMRDESKAFMARNTEGEAGKAIVAAAAERAWVRGEADTVRESLVHAANTAPEAGDDALGWAAYLLAGGDQDELAQRASAELKKRSSPEARAWALVADANRALQKKQWAEAKSLLEQAGSAKSSNLAAHALMGEAEARMGETGRAIERWRLLLAAEPKWLPVRLSLVSALLGDGRLEEAWREAQETYAHWPNKYAAIMAVGRTSVAMMEAGRADPETTGAVIEALLSLEKNEELKDKSEVVALLARALASQGRTEEAQARMDRVRSGEFNLSTGDLLALADVCRKRGLQGADELMSKAVADSGQDPSAIFAAALSAGQAGRADEGAAMLREAAASASDPEAKREFNRRLGVFLDLQGDPVGLQMLKEASVAHADNAAAQIDLLNSSAAWSDEPTIVGAIGRLRAVSGDLSTRWRIYEARRLLTFDPTPAKAASVVQPELLGEILRIEPNNAAALALAADAMLRVEPPNRDKAIEYLGRAVAAAPDQSALALRLVALLQDRGRSEEASTRLRELVRRANLPDDLRRQRADLLFRQGMWTEAEADLASIADSSKDPKDIARLGSLQARRGDKDQAKATFERAIAAEKVDAATLAMAADFFASAGEVDRGLALIQRIPAATDDPQRASATAAFYERAGKLEDAERTLAARARAAETPGAWADLAGFYLRRERLDDAKTAVERGMARDNKHADLRQIAGLLALTTGQPVAGVGVGDVGEGTESEGPVAMLMAAERLRQAEPTNSGAYIAKLSDARDAYPTFFPAWKRLIAAHLAADDGDGAAREALRASAAMPNSPEAAQAAVEVLSMLDRFEEAIAMAREWRNRSLDNPYKPEMAMARLEADAGRPAAAVPLVEPYRERIIAEADSNPDNFAFYARVLAAVGREAETDTLLRPKTELGSRWAVTYVNIARVLRDRPEAARAWIERSKPIAMKHPSARVALAQMQWDAATPGGAPKGPFEPILETLAGLDVDESVRGPASLLMAAAYEQMDKLPEAERCYRIAIEELPESPLPFNNLAYLLIRQGKSASEAAQLAEKGLEIARSTGVPAADQRSYIDTLGVAQLAAGAYEEASRTFSAGLESNPSDRNMLLGLAEAYHGLRRDQDAQSALRRFDAVQGGPALHPDYQKRLDTLRAEVAPR